MATRRAFPDPDRNHRQRELRRESTYPERLLWSRLRAGRLGGVKFRRQHSVGPYFVDFYSAQYALAIELDGLSHEGRADDDERRTAFLIEEGLQVVRFTNEQVLR